MRHPGGIPRRYAISIHALLAESDGFDSGDMVPAEKFLSTLSLRRATCSLLGTGCYAVISIHALLAESDQDLIAKELALAKISIHALLAESDKMHALIFANLMLFLSTLSLRRATLCK